MDCKERYFIVVRGEKHYRYKKEIYYLYIRVKGNMNFYRYIVFAMRRKQERLEEYLRRAGRLPTLPFFIITSSPRLWASLPTLLIHKFFYISIYKKLYIDLAPGGTRTHGFPVFSRALSQLSYRGEAEQSACHV